MTTLTGIVTKPDSSPLAGYWLVQATQPVFNNTTTPDTTILPAVATVATNADGSFSFNVYQTETTGVPYWFRFYVDLNADPILTFHAVVPDLPTVDLFDLLPAGVPIAQQQTTLRLLRSLVVDSLGNATNQAGGIVRVETPDPGGSPTLVYSKAQTDDLLNNVSTAQTLYNLNDVDRPTLLDGYYLYYDSVTQTFKGSAGTGAGFSPASSTQAGIVKTDSDSVDPTVYLSSSADALFARKGVNTDITSLAALTSITAGTANLTTANISTLNLTNTLLVPTPDGSNGGAAVNVSYINSLGTTVNPLRNDIYLTPYASNFTRADNQTSTTLYAVPVCKALQESGARTTAFTGLVALYDSSTASWVSRTLTTQISKTLASLPLDKSRVYTVYAYWTGAAVDIEFVQLEGTPANNYVLQGVSFEYRNGVAVKPGDHTRRFIGLIALNGSGQLVGSGSCWSMANRITHVLAASVPTTHSLTNTITINGTAYKYTFVTSSVQRVLAGPAVFINAPVSVNISGLGYQVGGSDTDQTIGYVSLAYQNKELNAYTWGNNVPRSWFRTNSLVIPSHHASHYNQLTGVTDIYPTYCPIVVTTGTTTGGSVSPIDPNAYAFHITRTA